jgi:disulfide bond formation protein DsbB
MGVGSDRPRQWRPRSYLPYLAWAQALVAMLGSLFFSEVMRLTPCSLCWYQRILMYPLVAILTVGILVRDERLRLYVLPLSISGIVVAAYHNLLYYGVLPEGLTQCSLGVSCTSRQIEWFGFVTIPLMSMTAFVVITVAMALYRPEGPEDD